MTGKIALLCLSLGVCYAASTGRYFGVAINRLFPCQQEPMNSFPCYGWIDLAILAVGAVAALALCVLIAIQLYKSYLA